MTVAVAAKAQDIHFSQYFAAPQVVNPALSGAFAGDYRFGLNYRTQWFSVTVPYRTFDLYGELSPWRSSTSGQYVSLGALLLADRAGDGNLTVIKTGMSAAMHLLPGLSRAHDLTLGVQAAWVQKKVDFSKFYWDNQWNDAGFDRDLPSGENFVAGQTSYADFAAGINYTYGGGGWLEAYTGLAVFHLTRPRESFYEQNNRLGRRSVAYTGLSCNIAEVLTISPSVFYQEQKKARELLFGGMLRYALPTSEQIPVASVYAGLYGRLSDALIAMGGIEVGHWRLLLSYDANTSALKAASKGRGAVELSLVHIGLMKKNQPLRLDLPCPRF